MKFSYFALTESAGSSIDPLGFLTPSGALTDAIFRQFTVLSNHPAYQGFLAFAYNFLHGKGITPQRRDFAQRFRDLEILWGVMNVRAGNSVVNVTKFALVKDAAQFSLPEIKHVQSLYARLSYGVLGHYMNPCVFWKILEPRGAGLTKRGHQLGESWSHRNRLDFSTIATRWLSGDNVYAIPSLEDYGEAFKLSGAPAAAEQQAWQTLINELCTRDPVTAPLWTNPVPDTILALLDQEQTYPSFFPSVLGHFEAHAELHRRIDLCNRFEQLSGLIQFVFEWEYVRRLEQVSKTGLNVGTLPQRVTMALSKAAAAFLEIQGVKDGWGLPHRLAPLSDHQAMANAIVSHHTDHQRKKGAAPFIVDDSIAIRERVNPREFLRFFEAIFNDPDRLEQATQWRYQRNWHFARADDWLRYAGAKP